MPRLLVLLSVLAVPFVAAAPAVAAPSPAPSASADAQVSDAAADATPAKNAGSIEGTVSAIDYQTNKMTVSVSTPPGKKTYDVVLQPGTTIQGREKSANFGTIADIAKGAHVQVLMSQKAGTYIAQIVKLL